MRLVIKPNLGLQYRAFYKVRFLAIVVVELRKSKEKMQAWISSLNDFIYLVAILPSTVGPSRMSVLEDLVELLSLTSDGLLSLLVHLAVSWIEDLLIICGQLNAECRQSRILAQSLNYSLTVRRRENRRFLSSDVAPTCGSIPEIISTSWSFVPSSRLHPYPSKVLIQQKAIRHPLDDRYRFAFSLGDSLHHSMSSTQWVVFWSEYHLAMEALHNARVLVSSPS